MRLLLVEDDPELAAALAAELARSGFAVDRCGDGIEAEFLGNEHPYDAIILDLGLPGRPGIEVLLRWRAVGNARPVLILTARDAWHERVAGFKAGADDYLGKPFHVEELIERVRALIRRSAGQAPAPLAVAGVRLDEDRQEVHTPDGATHPLTATEFRLLRVLMLHPGQVQSKTRLTEHVYDQDFDRDSNLIEVYVKRLRDKVGAERIQTRRGQGYVFIETLP